MKLFGKKNFSFQKGFTLIELLIVIAILGILAAAVLVAINPGQRIASARNSRVKADLANMANLANVFNADTGLSVACIGGGSYPSVFGQTLCGATYLVAPPPPTGAYIYTSSPASCAPNSTIPCTAISIYGPAYPDPNSTPPVTNTSSYWCFRSVSSIVSLVGTPATNCAP